MSCRRISALLAREIRCALREKNIVVNSLLIPLLLYPFMIWAAFTVVSLVESSTAGIRSRIGVSGVSAEISSGPAFRWAEVVQAGDRADSLLLDGSIEAAVVQAGDTSGCAGRPPLTVLRDGSRERSRIASDNAVSSLLDERGSWLRNLLASLGISPREWTPLQLELQNTASSRQMGAFILGLIIPITFIAMASVGCFYPAVDAFAGERERQTWETTLSTSAGRVEILISKFLYVGFFGLASGLLNIAAMTVSMSSLLGPLLRQSGEAVELSIPLHALPSLALGAVLMAAFLATGMILFGAYARTFKEGQAMITPFYMVSIIPVVFLQSPGLTYGSGIAAVPVVNVAMMAKEALVRPPAALDMAITTLSTLVFVAAGLFAAARMLGRDQALTPPDKGRPGLLRVFRSGRERSAGV